MMVPPDFDTANLTMLLEQAAVPHRRGVEIVVRVAVDRLQEWVVRYHCATGFQYATYLRRHVPWAARVLERREAKHEIELLGCEW